MKQDTKVRRVLREVQRGVVFFLLVAFVITCCITLFVSLLSAEMGLEFTSDNIEQAAKLTFLNVIAISVLFTVMDAIRRYVVVRRPVKRITDAAERMMQGDFSVRIAPVHGALDEDSFNTIADYLNRMAEELSGAETLRTDFIANVSHELKTPLAVIQNYAALLQKPGLSEEQRAEYTTAIVVSSRRLANLITNILKLNKLENQQVFPTAEQYDLGEQLCACVLQFETLWEEKRIDIHTDIADGVIVCADAELLSLVWNNLLSNAFKFTDSGGRVSVILSADEDSATVAVEDTGCGISREVGRHMFEKFYQGDTSRATQGNGLGLALVKRVVDIIGGDITVESEVGCGSRFAVRLRRGAYRALENTME